MLEKAVTAVKADKAKALADFNSPSGTFRDRDLYVFCSGPDGSLTAHPTIKGQQIASLVDKNGKKLGDDPRGRQGGPDRGGRLHVAAPRRRHHAGEEDQLRHQGRRPGMRRRLLLVASSARHCSEACLRANSCRLLPQIVCSWVARCGPLRLAWASATASSLWKIALRRREACGWPQGTCRRVRLRHGKCIEGRHVMIVRKILHGARGARCTRRRDARCCCIRPGGLLEPHLLVRQGHRTTAGHGGHRSARRLAPRSREPPGPESPRRGRKAGSPPGRKTGGLELELRRQGPPLQLRRVPRD